MDLENKLLAIFHDDYPGIDSFIQKVIVPVFGDEIEYINRDFIDDDLYRARAERAGIKRLLYVADITEQNYNSHQIALFDVTLDDRVNIERARVNIQAVIRSIVMQHSHILILFHYENSENQPWRFSYAYKQTSIADTTSARRFTYVFGKDYSGRTAANRFAELAASARSDADFVKAFSVQALSDDFFDEYREKYADFCQYITGKRYTKESGKYVEKQVGEPHALYSTTFGEDDKLVRDYIKKMFGRIVFLYFLQRKGWLDGNRRYMQDLFANSTQKDNFLDGVLEPLFFEVLNIDKQYRTEAARALPGSDNIPYLNGGLFAQDDIDALECRFPEEYFAKLFDFLDKYNFTIDENDANDAEIGIDPEMLGRIFENLLEDNKDKGAFYTPKEIVDYMCRESIIAYLQDGKYKEEGDALIRRFVETLDAEPLDAEQKIYLRRKLQAVKICDPAIGSGAFPMGLVNLLSKLYVAMKADTDTAKMKRHIMEQNIYGVDIEKGAVDIARLRFWLAMIVDEEEPMPLPNLHFKIMQGNSLLESYNGTDLSDLTKYEQKTIKKQFTIDYGDDTERKNLVEDLHKYYNTSDHNERDRLFTEIIKNVRRQLYEKNIILPEGTDPSANEDFFLWHTWFADVFANGGFDIVIANPPYISAPGQMAVPALKKQRMDIVRSNKYSTLYQKWDLYIPFMELGCRFLREGGAFAMIVPYPLSNQLYGKAFREWVISNYNVTEITDLNGTKIFDNATVSNLILFATASNPKNTINISQIKDGQISVAFKKTVADLIQDPKTQVWNLTEDKRAGSRHSNLPQIGDYCYISKGMVLNSDERTAKGEFTKDDLVSLVKDELHSREYIESKDFDKYQIKLFRYLEYGTSRCPNQISRPTFRELYECKKIIINRLGELKAVYDDFTPHLLQSDSSFMAILWEDLHGIENKSISSSIKKFSRYTRAEMEVLSQGINLKYILAILNSKYADVLLKDLRGGDYHIYPEHIRNLPIAPASSEVQERISKLVDVIISVKKQGNNTSAQEAEIDLLVYRLYGLTYDEVLVVDPNTPISREDYENHAN